jgi:hypothetical protein
MKENKVKTTLTTALVILMLIALAGCVPGKGALTATDEAARSLEELATQAGTTSREIENLEPGIRARTGTTDIEQWLARYRSEAPLQAQEVTDLEKLWSSFRKDAVCASLKFAVEKGRWPTEDEVFDYLRDEASDKLGDAFRGNSVTEGWLRESAKDINGIFDSAQAATGGDKRKLAALAVDLGCFDPMP